jgi:transposase
VADSFHVVRVGNRCIDKVRRQVQHETLGHRGRKHPLSRIREMLLSGAERLDDRGHGRMALGLLVGDPRDETLGRWLAKESVRDVCLTDNPKEAGVLLDKAIVDCRTDEVEDIRSLGHTLARRCTEILNHHRTGASNGPTQASICCVKRVKRCGTLGASRTTASGRCSTLGCYLAETTIAAAQPTQLSPLQQVGRQRPGLDIGTSDTASPER